MDVVRRGIQCHPCKGSKESEFCQVFFYGSLPLSKQNQLIVCCLCLVDGSEVDRENFEEFFECRVFEPFVVIPKKNQVCLLPFEDFLVSEEGKDECNLCFIRSIDMSVQL